MPDWTAEFREIAVDVAKQTGKPLPNFSSISNLPHKKDSFYRASTAVYSAIRSCAAFLRKSKSLLGAAAAHRRQPNQQGQLEAQVAVMLKTCGEQVDALQRNFMSMFNGV